MNDKGNGATNHRPLIKYKMEAEITRQEFQTKMRELLSSFDDIANQFEELVCKYARQANTIDYNHEVPIDLDKRLDRLALLRAWIEDELNREPSHGRKSKIRKIRKILGYVMIGW